MAGFFFEQSRYEPESEPTLTLSVVATREASMICGSMLAGKSMITFVGMGFLNARSIYVTRSASLGLKYSSRCARRINMRKLAQYLFFNLDTFNTGRDRRGIRDEIVRILDSHNLPIVAVKIQADKILRGTRGNALSDPDGFIADSAISGSAQVGQSLGRAKVQDGSGTFGGFLELRYPERQNWVTYGITCSQCVLPEEDQVKSSDAHLLQEWCRNRFGPENETARSVLRVEQPSAADMQRTIETCDKNTQKVISKRQIQINDAGEFAIPADEKKPNVKSCVEESWRLNRHHLGSVFAASGERVEDSVTILSVENPERHVDWALIDVPSHRIGDNEIITFGPRSGFLFSKGRKLWGPYPRTLLMVSLFTNAAMSPNTPREYNGIMTAHITHDMVNGVKVPKCTWAHKVTNHFREPFWAPGDTGAAVFDAIGTMAGLLFAGNERSRVSYFTHVYDLFDDIKQATGAAEMRVMEPPFDEEDKS